MKVKHLKKEQCFRILRRRQLGRIACSHNDQPYIVPLNFVFDGKKHLYASSLIGQKIIWMRENPLVCIEVDEIDGQNDWRTVVVNGHFEELFDIPEFEKERVLACDLLSKYPVWEQLPDDDAETDQKTSEDKIVFYRIAIKKITGHQKSQALQALFFKPPDFQTVSRGRSWGSDNIL